MDGDAATPESRAIPEYYRLIEFNGKQVLLLAEDSLAPSDVAAKADLIVRVPDCLPMSALGPVLGITTY